MLKNEQATRCRYLKKSCIFCFIGLVLLLINIIELSLLFDIDIFKINSISELLNTLKYTYPDKFSFIWNFWWIEYALSNGENIFYTKKLFYPNGTSLYLHTLSPFYGILSYFLLFKVSAVIKYNLTLSLIYLLNTISAFWLFKYLSKSNLIAFCFSTIICFQPYIFAHAVAGHLNLISIFEILFFILFLLKLQETKKNIYAFLLLITIIVMPFISLNYFYFCFLFIPIFFILNLTNIKKSDSKILITILLSLLILSPYLYKIYKAFQSGDFTNNHNPLKHSADILYFFIPNNFQYLNKLLNIEDNIFLLNASESSLYIGFGLILLLLFSLRKVYENSKSFKFLLISILFFGLTLGPTLTFNQVKITSYTPYSILSFLPAFPSVPARFMIFGLIMLLVALCKIKLNKILLTIFVIICCLEYSPSYNAFKYELKETKVLKQIKNNSKINSIYDAVDNEYSSKLRQTIHEKNISEAFIARKNKKNIQFLRKNSFIRFIKNKKYKESKLKEDFLKLKIDGVLISKDSFKLINKLSEISWLNLKYKESNFLFFSK